ncbi:MAG: exopolyphosphatase [Deltaproteobacteria bacterium]|nr:exopolyphosphatase [Deltaproteobacteria bacterium]
MRLVTRSDFDGLVCGVLLKSEGLVDRYAFVHPKDLQDGLFPVDKNDILANVAYAPGCGMWFDHHSSELDRVGTVAVEGLVKVAPSCARVVWEYFGGHAKFSAHLDSLLEAVDKVDSGMLHVDDVNNPKGWILLGFIMDPRTGMQNQSGFALSPYDLMVKLIDACAAMPADEVLALPDVAERCGRYFAQEAQFRGMLEQCSRREGNVLVTDLRRREELYTGNRFTAYAMFPDCNVSIQVMWGYKKQRVVLAVGHSILNRSSKADIGKLMLRYGGGGHVRVGTCQVPADKADAVLAEIIDAVRD